MKDKLFVLCEQQSIANHFLSELRDAAIQKDRMRFRRNLERIGEILSYEVSRAFSYKVQSVRSPLGDARMNLLNEYPVLITILRAGIPLHQGFLNFFDHADSGFIGAYREESSDAVRIHIDYASLPDIDGRPVILIDPMLATGRSVLDAQKLLLTKGTPSHLHIVSVVASPEGIRLLNENISLPFSVWTCAVDEKLNSSFYIVPGLGDAGDLSFGTRK
jgi:uracil phosphoribosyltransferase